MIMTTLCYIEKDNRYLMLHRISKKNDINKNKWIGVGGHFEAGESPEDCIMREVKEETGLTLTALRFRGILTFMPNAMETEYICLFTSDGFVGDLTDCNEGKLAWIHKEEIEKLNLWDGDRIFHQLLKNQHPFFSLKLLYDNDHLKEAWLDGIRLDMDEIENYY